MTCNCLPLPEPYQDNCPQHGLFECRVFKFLNIDVPRPVPVEWWGKDHWSTLAYVEVLCVDKRRISLARMRCDVQRHPALLSSVGVAIPKRYPTFLRTGELPDHDDWDCLRDAEAEGYLKIYGGSKGVLVDVEPGKRGPLAVRAQRTPLNIFGRSEICYPPRVRITVKGLHVVALLRQYKAQGGSFGGFVLSEVKVNA